MHTVTLTNDEYHRLMTERTKETLIGNYCEDYPCCGHTPDDPCTREWYDHPDAFNPLVNPHCFCEHEYGICDVDDRDEIDPDTCEHPNATQWSETWVCDDCDTEFVHE